MTCAGRARRRSLALPVSARTCRTSSAGNVLAITPRLMWSLTRTPAGKPAAARAIAANPARDSRQRTPSPPLTDRHWPKLRTSDGEGRKRFLFVAIDRRSRSVHLAVKDEETEAAAKAFLEEALAAFPFRVTHLLTDRGSCFTAEGFEKRCRELG